MYINKLFEALFKWLLKFVLLFFSLLNKKNSQKSQTIVEYRGPMLYAIDRTKNMYFNEFSNKKPRMTVN